MSIEAMTWAIKQKVGSSSAKSLLIVMANMANEHGICYPSQKYLSESVEQNIKTIQKNLNYLRDSGFISDTGRREGNTNSVIVFKISMFEAPPKTEDLSTTKNGRHPKTEDIQIYAEAPPIFPLSTPKNGGRNLKEHKGTYNALSALIDLGVDKQVAKDWLALRKRKRADVTKTVINQFQKKSSETGWSLNDIFVTCCERGWSGFDLSWLQGKEKQAASTQPWEVP